MLPKISPEVIANITKSGKLKNLNDKFNDFAIENPVITIIVDAVNIFAKKKNLNIITTSMLTALIVYRAIESQIEANELEKDWTC